MTKQTSIERTSIVDCYWCQKTGIRDGEKCGNCKGKGKFERPNFRSGSCRNAVYPSEVKSHTYLETEEGLFPMCGYGWNRSNGDGFSIFRGSHGTEGNCKLCQKNLASGKDPVFDGFPHKTKWL